MERLIPASPSDARIPIRVWARTIPEGALQQLDRIAMQPYVVGHVAAMPDLHVAHGVAVGTVFVTDGVLVPSALGGDLGCGVSAVQLDLSAQALGRRELERVLDGWSRSIPAGDAVHRGRRTIPAPLVETPLSTGTLEHQRERLVPRHLGTLGGGNHFLELDRDMDGATWLLVHSGSRGLGSAIGAHHVRAAEVMGHGEIPGLSVDSEPGRAFLADLSWALAFAAANRAALAEAALAVIAEVAGAAPAELMRIDVHHNYAIQEEHLGRSVWVHRKGAIAAPQGALVLIPGSMGTASYVARGRGEATSFRSASHGAGRTMTRREARERVPVERLEHAMRRVVHDGRRLSALLEEAPAVYRDIGEVLEDEADLVQPVARLEPLVVLKG